MVPVELTPWAVIGGFVVGLATIVLTVVRMLLTGRLVPGAIHNEVRADRDSYRIAAETALAASRELLAIHGRAVATLDQLTITQRETLDLVRRLVPIPSPHAPKVGETA